MIGLVSVSTLGIKDYNDKKINMRKKIEISRIILEAAKRYRIETSDSVKKEDLATFFKEAYANQFNAPDYEDEENAIRRWEWANLSNPNIYDKQFPSWVCKDRKSDTIVGHFGIIPVVLKYKENYYPAVWGRDLIVPLRFRKTGIGSFLFYSALELTKDRAALFMLAGLNDYAVTIYKRLGFIHLGYIPVYVRINTLKNIINTHINNRILADVLGAAGEGLLKIWDIFHTKYKENSEFIIQEITSFDNSFDNLWEETSFQFPIITKRDSTILNWRFVNQPYWKYKIFKVETKKERVTKGYVVLREGKSRGLKLGVISDLFAGVNDKQTIDFLLHFIVRYFKNINVDLIKCGILHNSFASQLKKAGFVRLYSNSHFMVTNIHEDLNKNFVLNRNNWFINYFDCDLDLSGQR
jgi:GNAT superfamily N-acetyltransferase